MMPCPPLPSIGIVNFRSNHDRLTLELAILVPLGDVQTVTLRIYCLRTVFSHVVNLIDAVHACRKVRILTIALLCSEGLNRGFLVLSDIVAAR